MSQIFTKNQLKNFDKNIDISSNDKDEYIKKGVNDSNNLNNPEENENIKDLKDIINNEESINLMENESNEIIGNKNNINNIKNINVNNFDEEEEENNNIINNNFEEELDNVNEEMNSDKENINKIKVENYDNNNDDEELPLITLNFISVCQCCKTSFDNNTYLPYLLKCGHFFCIKCINEYFTDKNGIKCPSDGLIANSINELTILNNLIPKNNKTNNIINNNLISKESNNNNNNIICDNNLGNKQNKENNILSKNSNYCSIHKNQKLSHVICDSNEIICVYCAFECFKKNPKSEIKELSSQLKDFNLNINEIISENQKEVLNLNDSLKKIKTNKENVEKAINTFFECLFDYLNEKKNEYFDQVNNLFSNNTKILGDKLEEVNENIENSENLKKIIENFLNDEGINEYNFKEKYNELLNKYLELEQKNKNNKQKIELDEYKFIHIDEDKLVKNCHGLGDIKIINKKYKINLNDDLNNNKRDRNIKKLFKNNILDLKLKSIEKEKDYPINNNKILEITKEQIMNSHENKSIENKTRKNQIGLNYFKKNNLSYIILDDLSLNNNSFLNNDKNTLKLETNNESYNNYLINENNVDYENKGYHIFNKKNSHNMVRKNTFNSTNSKEKKVIIHKNSKSVYNYIEFPNYNNPLNNYYLLSKINNKKEKERNITVNNYEVYQTLKNSFNNNYNYGHHYNNTNCLKKLFESNNTNFFTNNNIQSNRKKFSFLVGSKNRNKIFDFK